MSRKAGEGLESPCKGRVESRPGDSPANRANIGGEETIMTCGLARDLATVCTAQQEQDKVSEVPANSKPLAIFVQKEQVSEEGAPPGELDRESEGLIGVPPDYRLQIVQQV